MKSLRQPIDAKCKDCIYDPGSGLGTWREQIAQCAAFACPLWPVRTGPESGPYQRPAIDAELRQAADKRRRARLPGNSGMEGTP
ncbi:hypothetical protein SSPSH_000063 [Salinisphaera shabanensis E1L3A]|uniref:Uncharacterized protein n=1 Tax=Salinisphaera shabanensis E1L3A TaxID=1033802 RepID=U2EAP0_9GAMM|nr:hypothetical protein [Salinisphaera shabanensis]ERJ20721.1 hypothetical protein SSPSH_000063 [Salinisphaera shabanensis E1L3A]